MACSFPTSSTYGVSGFPGTPEEFKTSYPLSSATGGPLGPSAGPSARPSVTNVRRANTQSMPNSNQSWFFGIGVVVLVLALLYFLLRRSFAT